MMHIDMSDKTPPASWCQKAEKSTKDLLNCKTEEEREELLKKRKKVWGELAEWLLSYSYGKCWYSESSEGVSPYNVDHFRPIHSAKQLDGSKIGGYWWLAFDWKNYRVAGFICNRAKWDYFPLRNVQREIITPGCVLDSEEHYLLDPTIFRDTLLLTFEETGKALPAVNGETWEFQRANESIRLLNLNFRFLKNKRQRVWSRCFIKINRIKKYKVHIENAADENTKNAYIEIYNDLIDEVTEMISPSSELSSTAKACLISNGYSWLIEKRKTEQNYEH